MNSEPEQQGPPQGASEGSLREWLHTWRFFFGLLALCGRVAFFYAEENRRGARAWQKYKEQMLAKGARVDPSAFVPPPVPDEDNFAMTPFLAPLFGSPSGATSGQYHKVIEQVQSLGGRCEGAAKALNPKSHDRISSWVTAPADRACWQAALLRLTNQPSKSDTELPPPNVDLPQAAAGMLAALSVSEPALDELRSSSTRPHSRFNIHYEQEDPAAILLPHLAFLKQLCQVLRLRAQAELALGKTEPAFEDLRLLFTLTDATREEPILISQLVRFAEFQLALQPLVDGFEHWTEPQLQALEDRLRRFDFCADATRALQAEQVFFGSGIIEYVRHSPNQIRVLASGGFPGNGPSGGPEVAVLLSIAPQGWFDLEQLNHARLYRDYILPTLDVEHRRVYPAAVHRAEQRLSDLTNYSGLTLLLQHRFFCALLLPAVSRAIERAAYVQSAADAALVACALERYRRAKGEFPESLQALTPQFIDPLPRDLMNGKPLQYHRTQNGQYLL